MQVLYLDIFGSTGPLYRQSPQNPISASADQLAGNIQKCPKNAKIQGKTIKTEKIW